MGNLNNLQAELVIQQQAEEIAELKDKLSRRNKQVADTKHKLAEVRKRLKTIFNTMDIAYEQGNVSPIVYNTVEGFNS